MGYFSRSFFLVAALCFMGCAAQPVNPSFSVSSDQAARCVADMRDHPKPLSRPLVIVGGFMDPNLTTPFYARFFGGLTHDSRIISVGIGWSGSFEECRAKIIDAVDQAFPSADPQWTTEVDVIGLSMGGLAARYSAAPSLNTEHPRRLKIARLFTVSSPHQGATLAQKISLCDFHRDMRPGSKFIEFVASNDATARYELYPYVHLNDEMVGEQYAAPRGVNPFWLANGYAPSAHMAAMVDDRILSDIALRLRGETPFTHLPADPLPNLASANQ